MKISSLYEIYLQHPEITTDSRNCSEGSIFFALKGANFNGNRYAEKALEQGCSYAIVDEKEYATQPNIIWVEDSLIALQQLARHHRSKLKIPIIGITGTNGKTTTKELVKSVLKQEHNVISTQGNYNNHIGVPLTLLRIRKEHEIAIIEMGANHVGEIKALCEIADPNYGLITNIGHAHLEGFGSYENIIKTKGELYDYIAKRKDGKLFVNYDNTLLREMAKDTTSIFYGLENSNNNQFVTGKVISADPFLKFEWELVSSCHIVETRLIGDYNLSNTLAAVAIGKYFGVNSSLICDAISVYEPVNNRSQLKETATNMLIIDAYNANPTSMQAALQNFEHMKVNKKVLIIGEMKELGPDSDMEHQKIVDYVAKRNFAEALFVGESFCRTKTSLPCFKTTDELKQRLEQKPILDSYILLKGSRGMQLEKCIEYL